MGRSDDWDDGTVNHAASAEWNAGASQNRTVAGTDSPVDRSETSGQTTEVRYRTIVADPPWDHSDGTGRHLGKRDHRLSDKQREAAPTDYWPDLPYGVMSLEEICALPVRDLAERDAHLYLWTTNRYLREAYYVCEAWGFSPVKPLVWCKEPMGFMGRPFTSSAEFVVFARRGVLKAKGEAGRQWWVWPRSAHSAKPEAFLDLVEQISPGPYAELFSRRARFGWDYPIGNQALGGVAA